MNSVVLDFLWSPAGILTAVLTVFFVHTLTYYFKLLKFPGPPLATVSNWPHSWALLSDDTHLWYARVSEKYGKLTPKSLYKLGKIARIAPNVLLTSSIDLWIHVNKDRRYKRSDWYYHTLRFEHRRDNVFTQTDNRKHDELRRKMMPGYSGRENRELEGSVDEIVRDMLSTLRQKYLSTTSRTNMVDLAPKVQFFTLDVISSVAFGRKFGMLATDSDVDGYLKSSLEGFHVFRIIMGLGLGRLVQAPFVGRFLAASPQDDNGFGRMMAFAFKAADERAANPTDERSDMLASFIRNGIVGADLKTEVIEQIVAGSDTTAGGIRGTILHILTNPLVYTRLQGEIDSAAVPEGQIITFAQARSLPYLQAVIKEGLRIWPPVTNFFCRDVPPEGDNVTLPGGEVVHLPGGTSIGPSTVALHLDTEVFGDDAKIFRPERWFEEDKGKLERMQEVSELMFGYGRWKCLGQPVARLELSKLVFELFRNFDIAIVNPLKPWDAKCFFGLFGVSDMWVQIRERSRV